MRTTHLLRSLGLLALLAVSAVALAACGSSSSSSGSSTSTSTQASASGPGSAQRTKLRACLQQHGVTLPQRRPGGGGYGGPPGGGGGYGPPAGGGGFVPGAGAGGAGGFAQRNPKLAAALKACGGGNFRGGAGGRFRLNRTNLNKYVSCVRSHGYNLPNPNFSGKGPVFPASIRTNKKFLAASKACQSLLVPQRPTTTTTTSTKSA